MKQLELFTSDRLFCPGPTPVPKAVLDAGTETSVYHRSEEFYKVFRRCAERLQPIFGTTTQPIILACSGTGAMEAVLVNLTAPGDQVITVNGGKFGERWGKLAQAYECATETVAVANGHAPTLAQLREALQKQPANKALFFQANETSTGAYYPVADLCRALRADGYDGLIIVDAISSLVAHEMRMDEWGIDAVVAGSQKGFGIPPGLAFAALSPRAWKALSKRPRFYFDLEKERKGQAEGRSAWTTASSLIFQLDKALEILHASGLEQVYAHHTQLGRAARAGIQAIGLSLFAGSAPSSALTAITVPPGIDGSALVKRLRQRFGMFFAGGQDELKGKIVRFAHLGFVSRFDLIDGMAAFEFALAEEGYRFTLGDGVKAAMQALHQAE